jgi:hypothetical protein
MALVQQVNLIHTTYLYFDGYDRNKPCNEILAFCPLDFHIYSNYCVICTHSIMLHGYHQIVIIIITLRVNSAVIEQEFNYIIIIIIIINHHHYSLASL